MPRRALRKRYIIKRGLQFRYIGIVFLLALITSIVTGYTVFATGWGLLGERLANVYPQGRLADVFKATNIALARNLLFVSPFIFILGLLFSHKIAGPVYRIEKTLVEISKGNLPLKIKLRRGDELSDLAEVINVLTDNLNKSIISDKEAVLRIQRELGFIKKTISSQPYDCKIVETSLVTLQTELERLSASLDKWKTSS